MSKGNQISSVETVAANTGVKIQIPILITEQGEEGAIYES